MRHILKMVARSTVEHSLLLQRDNEEIGADRKCDSASRWKGSPSLLPNRKGRIESEFVVLHFLSCPPGASAVRKLGACAALAFGSGSVVETDESWPNADAVLLSSLCLVLARGR